MDKRKSLLISVACLGTIGLLFVGAVFFYALGPTKGSENDAWAEIDLSGMKPGEVNDVGWAWIYRRHEEDKARVGAYLEMLADPESAHSTQPESSKNQWRSASPDFFVFLPWAPQRGCGVIFRAKGTNVGDWWPEHKIASEIPHFIEPCEGRIFDSSGRLFLRRGYPPEQNLSVPYTKWITPTKVLVWKARTPPRSEAK